MRRRFIAEIVHDDALVARDLWRKGSVVPLVDDARLSPGAFAEVKVKNGIAHPVDGFSASPGSAMATLIRIAAEEGVDPIFPPKVERETKDVVARPDLDDRTLGDLSDVPFVTIDNEGSRDLDQALHIERADKGYRVRYALADAAHYVRPGMALFTEALSRGASYYFPGFNVPMLPRALSEGLVSLNPRVVRRAFVFDMRLDRDGSCVETKVSRARIESRAQLTFEGVQSFLDGDKRSSIVGQPYAESLELLREVGQVRIADAAARDVAQHRRIQVEIGLAGRRSFVVYGALRNDVERYNEQISLLCNIEGARLLRLGESSPLLSPIYRVHPPPPEERVRTLARTIDELIRVHHLSDRWHWERERGQSLARYLDGLPRTGEQARIARAIERQAIMMNVRSTFSATAGVHHGVGAEVYARFSAPMREIVGIFLHKELWEHLSGNEERLSGAPPDEVLRTRVLSAANRSKDVQRHIERETDRLALDELFAGDLADGKGKVRYATVMGISADKIYLALEEPPLEVKIYVDDLERTLGAQLALGQGEVTVEHRDGSIVARLGDRIGVSVSHRDEKHDRWVLVPR